jgi:hypothetical protein
MFMIRFSYPDQILIRLDLIDNPSYGSGVFLQDSQALRWPMRGEHEAGLHGGGYVVAWVAAESGAHAIANQRRLQIKVSSQIKAKRPPVSHRRPFRIGMAY